MTRWIQCAKPCARLGTRCWSVVGSVHPLFNDLEKRPSDTEYAYNSAVPKYHVCYGRFMQRSPITKYPLRFRSPSRVLRCCRVEVPRENYKKYLTGTMNYAGRPRPSGLMLSYHLGRVLPKTRCLARITILSVTIFKEKRYGKYL